MEEIKEVEKLSWISKFTPCFVVNGDDIQVLYTPSEFYLALLNGIKSAKKRIVLSALYLGAGAKETELVNILHETLSRHKLEQTSIDVDLLFDYARGTRSGTKNSRSVLLPLVNEFSDPSNPSSVSLNVSFFHTPQLRGIWKWLLPARWNEVLGVAHFKVYLFDDTLILSGANLSHDYFTNRQDRYIEFRKCQQLGDYFHALVKAVGTFSFNLEYDGSLKFSDQCPHHPVTGNYKQFVQFVAKSMEDIIFPKDMPKVSTNFPHDYKSPLLQSYWKATNLQRQKNKMQLQATTSEECDMGDDLTSDEQVPEGDTLVFPSVQIGFAGICQDEMITEKLLEFFPDSSHVCFTSGYFNVTNRYSSLVVNGSARYDIFTASPEANGFLGAAGVAGYVPSMYVYLVHKFYNQLLKNNRQNNVYLWEYTRPQWTYHAKGLWYYNASSLPIATMIGSPNFGYRSVCRDLEAQAVVVTSNIKLRKQLHKEKCQIHEYSTRVTNDTFLQQRYFVHRWVKAVSGFIKRFF